VASAVAVDDLHDERIADYVALRDRDRPDVLIAEGALVIRHLLASPYRVRSVLVTPRGLRALEAELDAADAPVYLAPQRLVETVAGYKFHRGALAAADRAPLPDLTAVAGADLLVVAEGVNDHENLGALFRNAAAFGAGGVLLDPTSVDPLYRRSIRVSMGHVLRMPFTRLPEWPAAVATLQALGYEVLALTPGDDAEDLAAVAPGPRQALLVGAEGPGLSKGALAAADRRVRIPLAGHVDSLNLATAAAVALYHLRYGR
jgi:tRNA G18 (ribose-2'-O)-methylase SpoU